MLQTVNVTALEKAAVAIVGTQAFAVITSLYQMLDQAIKDGYELGRIDAEQNVEERLDAAFDNGFEQGSEFLADAEANEQQAYDEGYLEGVSDARARPDVADDTVAAIISDLTQEAINGEVVIEVIPQFIGISSDDLYRMRKGDLN